MPNLLSTASSYYSHHAGGHGGEEMDVRNHKCRNCGEDMPVGQAV